MAGSFDAQATSRHLDLVARRAAGRRGAASTRSARPGTRATRWSRLALRPTDPALLHYRSGGVLLRPGRAGAGVDAGPRRAAGADGAGRRADRRRPAQGVRAPRPGDHPADVDHRLAPAARGRAGHRAAPGAPARSRLASGRRDAVVVCSFGDASANHSTAAGAINTALNTAFRGLPVPILFVCEDNGLGISVPTPTGWIEHAYGSRPGLRLRRRRRRRPGRGRGRRSPRPSRRVREQPAAGLPAPADRPLPRPRRQRRRDRLPDADARSRPTTPATLLATARALVAAGADAGRRARPLRRPCGTRSTPRPRGSAGDRAARPRPRR